MTCKSTQKYIAELIGTMVLVLFGCGSAVLAGDAIGFTGISFAFGIAVLMMAYAIGPISGCHINPAVTVGMLVAKKISARDAVMYIIAQCIGATAGAGVLYLIATGKAGYSLELNGLGQNGFGAGSPDGYGMEAAFITEVVLTAIFLFVIHGATTGKIAATNFAGIAIGLALVAIHLLSIPVTGTSVNPARSFGPAIFVQGLALEQLWLFIVAPVIGAILGTVAWNVVSCDTKK